MIIEKKRNKVKLLIFFIIIFVLGVLFYSLFFIADNPPKIFLWAWERPEDLLFLDDKNIGIAFYSGTLIFDDSDVFFSPRLQLLKTNPETRVMPVVRIVNQERQTELSDEQIEKAVDLIVKNCTQEKVSACQIDFDVKSSEIDCYKKMINKLRKKLPRSISLSVTTLVSWCHSGSWIDDLPIDKAVPMFFSLGADEYVIREGLTGQSFMQAKHCQKAIGISINEPLPEEKYLKNKTIYIFNNRAWTDEDFHNIINKI